MISPAQQKKKGLICVEQKKGDNKWYNTFLSYTIYNYINFLLRCQLILLKLLVPDETLLFIHKFNRFNLVVKTKNQKKKIGGI